MYDGNKIKTEFIKSSSDNLKMKVIFLDVDGVLNSDEYIHKVIKKKINGIESEIDVEKIKLLKKAVDETGANVVLSSSWRYTRNAQYLKELLLRYGINAD